MTNHKYHIRKPRWLKRPLPTGSAYEGVRALMAQSRLHTVCSEARCPNIWECFSRQTATFMILGNQCTRNCRFCAVTHGHPDPPDPDEPVRVAEAAKSMQLSYVVITSVTRDDLPDGGADIFARTITEIRTQITNALVEVLIPDFQGNTDALHKVVSAHPDVLNHNLETVPRLYAAVRPDAVYHRSLELLKQVSQQPTANSQQPKNKILTKSGLMLGLGESEQEIRSTLEDILDTGCSILTLGQYLQPTPQHLPVERFVCPEEFDTWRDIALKMGFLKVISGPLVRSSYRAREMLSD